MTETNKVAEDKQKSYQCIGCGAEIQTDHPDQPGFLPKKALEKGQGGDGFYCQRCFRLRHYNELQDYKISDDYFLEQVSRIAEDPQAYVLHLIDICDIEGTLLHGIERMTGGCPFSVVANKVDLLPKSLKLNRIYTRLQALLKDQGLYPQDILMMSAKQMHYLDSLRDYLTDLLQTYNVYLVGVTNVGKSSLINQLLAGLGGDKELITTSNVPGTTLDFIDIPLTDDHFLVDTPGIIQKEQVTRYISKDSIKKVLPGQTLKPRSFQLQPGQTIFLAGLGRVDFLEGERTSFTYYVSNNLVLHRSKTEKANDLYLKHLGDLLSPPNQKDLEGFPELRSVDISLNSDQELAIAGLGWVSVNQKVTLRLYLPKPVSYAVRPALI